MGKAWMTWPYGAKAAVVRGSATNARGAVEEVEEGEMDEMRDEMEVGRDEPSSPARGTTAVSPSFRPKTLSRLTPPSATANAIWFSQGCGAVLKENTYQGRWSFERG